MQVKHVFTGVESMYLFGSAAGDSYTDTSDVDIALYSERSLEPTKLWELKAEIANTVHREVDLIDLRSSNTVFQMQVISTGQRIYCENPPKSEAYESLIFSMYLKLNEDRQAVLETIQKDRKVYG